MGYETAQGVIEHEGSAVLSLLIARQVAGLGAELVVGAEGASAEDDRWR